MLENMGQAALGAVAIGAVLWLFTKGALWLMSRADPVSRAERRARREARR